jgi:hypothetical protein
MDIVRVVFALRMESAGGDADKGGIYEERCKTVNRIVVACFFLYGRPGSGYAFD